MPRIKLTLSFQVFQGLIIVSFEMVEMPRKGWRVELAR